MCLSTEYINLCVPMQWMCNKGHKWFANFNSIKHVGTWCPYCLDKHENLCRKVIINILGPPLGIHRPDFLKTPKHPQGLEFVIYYPKFRQAVIAQPSPPEVQQFPVFPTNAQPLRIEPNVTTCFQNNVLWPVETILQAQGAEFNEDSHGLLGSPDYVLRTNQGPRMPLEIKTRHNLDLRDYNIWEIY
ncbi:hypothetical protein RclHR1_07720009 [Rhizophagus clarus]|uniref:Uncharacterized protein n=1 Tax=Rhizophagus clarus TaxID=94130 RepID=A0A2Z6S9N4_9GLOM|nr:hypothetical protein RclHR1_07720009 [Rhizophagus clarus]